ncbi:MAG TPA: hypothetical protein VFZ25_21340 [Chloroflexota bacterium]|nr:hypothetical protein [Chloroflexota bacterium]
MKATNGAKGGQVEMEERGTQQLLVDEQTASEEDWIGSFCPECGQSLDLARHHEAPGKRQTWESFIFLIFGLGLTVAFGLRCWNSQLRLSGLDRQIADLRAHAKQSFVPLRGNPSMIMADTMSGLLTEQQDLQLRFQRDLTGLAIGLFTLVIGAANWRHEWPGSVDWWGNRRRPPEFPRSRRSHVGTRAWNLGGPVATSLARVAVVLFVTNLGLQLIRGAPPSLQLVDHALTHIVAIVFTIAASLS